MKKTYNKYVSDNRDYDKRFPFGYKKIYYLCCARFSIFSSIRRPLWRHRVGKEPFPVFELLSKKKTEIRVLTFHRSAYVFRIFTLAISRFAIYRGDRRCL